MKQELFIRRFANFQEYASIWRQMQLFTEQRTTDTADELWLLQHYPVFTQGLAGKAEHVLMPGSIPVIQTDRGGQVTYHGPGQLVVYALLDLNRLQIGTRQLVRRLEKSIIRLLSDFNLQAFSKCEAPGVYINDAKICSVGLRVRKGYCYHGLALNLDMDLQPFRLINPCGYRGLRMTQLKDFVASLDWVAIEGKIIQYLAEEFRFRYQLSLA